MSSLAPNAAVAVAAQRQRRLVLDRSIAAAFGLACLLHVGLTAQGLLVGAAVIVLVELAAIDLEQRILPNRIVLPATAAILLLRVAIDPSSFLEWIVAAVGAAAFLLLPLIVRRDAMGMGDVKLALLLGVLLGRSVAAALTIGLCASGGAALLLVAQGGRAALRRPIPLGPFLAGGAIAAILLSPPGVLS